MNEDLIARNAAIDALRVAYWDNNIQSAKDDPCIVDAMTDWAIRQVKALPSAQHFHNITMNDVLKYIDGMPEDVWQEFTACLECRGWELQRRTAKWCGGEFA